MKDVNTQLISQEATALFERSTQDGNLDTLYERVEDEVERLRIMFMYGMLIGSRRGYEIALGEVEIENLQKQTKFSEN